MTRPERKPVGTKEIADLLRVPRDTIKKWRERYSDFPDPRWPVGGNPAFDWWEVAGWLRATNRNEDELDHLDLTASPAEIEQIRREEQQIRRRRHIRQGITIDGDGDIRDVHHQGEHIGVVCRINWPGKGEGWETRHMHEIAIVNHYGFGFYRNPVDAALDLAAGPTTA